MNRYLDTVLLVTINVSLENSYSHETHFNTEVKVSDNNLTIIQE